MKHIPILMYHQIDRKPVKGTPMRGLVVSPFTFFTHMLALWLCGYRGLSMSQLEPYLQGHRQGRVFGITFDDGYANNLHNALPILQRFGFSSTCYVVVDRIGQTNVWDQHHGIPQVPLMNLPQLQDWMLGGQEVGSHGMTHANLTQLNDKQKAHEIMKSRVVLQDLLQQEQGVLHFCYPYGAYDAACQQHAMNAGYTSATTTRRARVNLAAAVDFMQLPRVLVSRTTTWLHLWLKIFTGYEDRS